MGVIYRPNTFPRADIDVSTLGVTDTLMVKIRTVILGYMNINMLNYCFHDQTDTNVDSILKPTRVTHTTATLLDHIIFPLVEPRSGCETIVLRLFVCLCVCVCPSAMTLKWHNIVNKAIRDGKYLARHMPVLGNVHPIKFENIDIFS